MDNSSNTKLNSIGTSNNNDKKTILVIEDNVENRFLVCSALKDFALIEAENLKEAKKVLEETAVDVILLDINLPDGDGLTFLSLFEANEHLKNIPVLIVSANSSIPNKAAAFSLGAEDFLSKPFDPAELRIRVVARLKKAAEKDMSEDSLRCHDLKVSLSSQRVYINGENSPAEAISLTSKEFQILTHLMKNFDRICTRESLLDKVWGHGVNVIDRTVDTHISHLRRKIAKSKLKIEATPNVGYRLGFAGVNSIAN